jgi:Fe-S-cluster-containing dehydrogenase component
MTSLPATTAKKLGLLIDLDICVGCHACAVACKEWNAAGISAPLPDQDAYGDEPDGVWFNRVHSFELEALETNAQPASTLHFPRSCLHCETPACVSVCPTGASYKRAEDGIVLVDADKCIGCKLCSWACPYGAREYSPTEGVMKKCTLCVDRIYNQHIPEAQRQPACVQACPTRARSFGDFADPDSEVSIKSRERNGQALMPQLDYKPVNRYLPPRAKQTICAAPADEALDPSELPSALRWLDKILSR